MDPTQNTVGQTTQVVPPYVPTTNELFDAIMTDIDPRFTIDGQTVIAGQLQQATEAEKIAIIGDFQTALRKFEEDAKLYFRFLSSAVSQYASHVESLAQSLDLANATDDLFSAQP